MEQLAKLLGGQDRVKLMRLFLHNQELTLTPKEIIEKTKSKSDVIRKEINTLLAIGFLEKKKTKSYSTVGLGKKAKQVVKESFSFKLNETFAHNQALRDLLFDFESVDKKDLASRFKAVGRIKLFLVSGIFVGDKDSRVDVLIVGEALKREKGDKVFENLAAEFGRDVAYAIMDLEEFEYRFKMYDKFIRDILDMPHEKVIDKINKKATD
jgi:hypothetical protein